MTLLARRPGDTPPAAAARRRLAAVGTGSAAAAFALTWIAAPALWPAPGSPAGGRPAPADSGPAVPGSASPAAGGAASPPAGALLANTEVVAPGCEANDLWRLPLTPEAVRRLDAPGSDPDAWARERRGAIAGRSLTEAVVQSTADRQIDLRRLSVKTVARSTARTGTVVSVLVDPQCGGGPREVVHVTVDIDRDPPVVKGKRADDTPVNLNALQLSVDPRRSVTFEITTLSTTCDCTWTAELSYVDQGRSETVAIDDRGTPFRIVPGDTAHLRYSRLQGNRWLDAEPRN
ncbi:hypothetical protein [Kitasatospora sp. NPDC085879]|uniref:hypothetical protein n=1 Tax=Kitasatospora sp. NPDC085879 TaxID=3154769 RepID=UPI003447AA0B